VQALYAHVEGRAVVALDRHHALADDRLIELADLMPLRQIRIEVVLPIEAALQVDLPLHVAEEGRHQVTFRLMLCRVGHYEQRSVQATVLARLPVNSLPESQVLFDVEDLRPNHPKAPFIIGIIRSCREHPECDLPPTVPPRPLPRLTVDRWADLQATRASH